MQQRRPATAHRSPGLEVPEELSTKTFQAIDELAGDLLRVG
jgi:hypothetical protein